MKYLLLLLTLTSTMSFACDDDNLKGYTDAQKFLEVVENSEFLFIGKVERLYRLPETRDDFPGYNGFVFKVEELIKGKTLSYVEAEQSSFCGVNSPFTENYWPEDVGKKYVVTGIQKNGINYILAVYPFERATDVLHQTAQSE